MVRISLLESCPPRARPRRLKRHFECLTVVGPVNPLIGRRRGQLMEGTATVSSFLRYGWNSVRKLCCFAAHIFHSARHSTAFNVRMIALQPNFDCATLIVIHLCATYLRRCIFAAEVKGDANSRDIHKNTTSARHS